MSLKHDDGNDDDIVAFVVVVIATSVDAWAYAFRQTYLIIIRMMKHQEVKWMKMNARMNENDSGF